MQAIGQFAKATYAPEFGTSKTVGGGAVKQRVKFKTNKFQNKKKKVQNKGGVKSKQT